MHTVRVALGARSYEILVGERLLPSLGARCRRLDLGRRCAVLTDSRVAGPHLDPVLRSLQGAGFDAFPLVIPAGERSKSVRQWGRCLDALAARRLERSSFLVALGGGVVGDLAGFVAASYLRGLAFVQVPTTLLAQVDSSVGGKTGLNLRAGKNLVGAFWQPRLVLCDLDTLRTLPEREYRSGLAEVIKYGVIRDARFFRRLESGLPKLQALEARELAAVVARSCAIKAAVVGADETESGERAILNFGHTIGHALEAVAGYGHYLHGEAIAIGQVLAGRLSVMRGGLAPKDLERLTRLLESAGLPVTLSFGKQTIRRLLDAMMLDKKVQGGQPRFVLADKLGSVRYGVPVPSEHLRFILETASQRHWVAPN